MPEVAVQPVFLSYAREDSAAAGRIADALRSHGIEVWFDQSELRGGDAWDEKIRKQIRECTLFIPIISDHTESRGEGYFRLEWKLAVERTHLMADGVPFVAPVAIDGTQESGAAVPAEFLRVQWSRLPAGLPTPQFVEQINRLLQRPKKPKGAAATSVASQSNSSHKTGIASWVVAGLGIAALCAGAFLAFHKAGPAPEAPAEAHTEAKPEEKSIAVLPLTDMSADQKSGFFADGVHDELITDLAAIADLKVISRTSVLQYRDAHANLKTIGRELGVTYVAEGSVRREGNRVRITAQLIDTRTDTNVWAGTFEKELSDVFVLQASLAQDIAGALQAHLTPAETRRIERPRGASPQVYELVQRARTIIFSTDSTRADYAMASGLAAQAVEEEPNFALGWATVGHVDVAMVYRGFDTRAQRAADGKRAIERALQIDPNLPEAHWALGRYHSDAASGKSFVELADKARSEMELARESMPNQPRVLSDIAEVVYFGNGDSEGALALQRRALELDPKDPLAHYDLGRMLFDLGRYSDAEASFETARRLSPAFVGAITHITLCRLAQSGDLDGAQRALDLMPSTQMDDRAIYFRFQLAYWRRDAAAALRILHESPISFFHDNTAYGPREFFEGEILEMTGDQAGARQKYSDALKLLGSVESGDFSQHNSLRANLSAALGDEANAMKYMGQFEHGQLDLPSADRRTNLLHAQVFTRLGKEDQAIDALEKTLKINGQQTPFTLKLDPEWDPLRNNPRFQKLLLLPLTHG